MKSKIIYMFLLAGILAFFLGCTQQEESQGKCAPSYAAHLYEGSDWCCMDENSDGVCDKGEISAGLDLRFNKVKRARTLFSALRD